MVEKIIITPESVRGLGNIISPAKTPEDFPMGWLTNITLTDGVFTMMYSNKSIVITVAHNYVKQSGTLTLNITATDQDGNPVEDVELELFKEVQE